MTDAPQHDDPRVRTAREGALAVVRLDRPRALNALSPALIDELTAALNAALADPAVAAIWLESTTAKAFCAGGDVKALAGAMRDAGSDEQRRLGERYFAAEYRLDALIEHSAKPIVAYGRGLVMGGGWGLLAGADLRLVDDTSRFAMPELQIGLFPDVGAAHFLQRPHWRAGTLLGIAGVHLDSRDVLALGYADARVDDDSAAALRAALAGGTPLAELTLPATPAGLDAHRDAWLGALDGLGEPVLADWMARIRASDFAPFRAAAEQWRTGSALSIALTWHHFRRLRQASRLEALEADRIVGANACAEREFAEGVRALLIDKDKQPAWQYPEVAAVPFSLIERFYQPLPFATEPLAAAGG